MDRFRKSFSDCFSPAVAALVVICFLIIRDPGTTAALGWLAVVFSISFITRPFMSNGTETFDERFALRFGLGFFLCFYSAWVISAVFKIDYSDAICHITFLVLAAAGYAVRRFSEKKPYITRGEFFRFLNGFAIFAVIFLVFFWVIGFNPVIDPGTENYMDFGFMQTIYRQKTAVPKDLWFSGTNLNYYYLGQSAAVYMCRLSHTTPEYGYNLMLATFSGMVFLMTLEIVYSAVIYLIPRSEKRKTCAALGGVAGATVAAFAGNPHWLLYGIFIPFCDKITGSLRELSYWISDGTVYIRQEIGDADNGKTEFPAYSAILGDLHAHVINLIFVLPLVMLLFDLCFEKKEDDRKLSGLYYLIMISMLLGFYKGTNYWDFAIYYVITGAVIVFTDLKRSGLLPSTIGRIVVKAALVTAVSFVVILPFTLNFVKMESGIEIAPVHSPLIKLLVLWAPFVAVTCGLIYYLYFAKRIEGIPEVTRAGLLAFMLCTIGLVIVPEIIYVKDIYGENNLRFNTMFKLTYQAFVLFAVITGITFALMIADVYSRREVAWGKNALLFVMGLYIILSATYTVHSVNRWYGKITDPSKRRGISALQSLRNDDTYGFEMEAYDVLMADDKRVLNIVEAAGNSYTHESALSVYTGACTPAGWFVHEWMWHNDPDPIRERADRVAFFYTGGNEEYCRNFLKLYDVDYILVGPAEVCRYPVNREGFKNLGQVIVRTVWMDSELSLIKVDRSTL